MAYIDNRGAVDRKTAIIGVAAIHALIGTVLITGLSGVVFPETEDKRLEARNVKMPITPPPPPDPVEDVRQDTPQSDTTVFAPDPPIDLSRDTPPFDTTQDPPLDNKIVKNPIPPFNPGIGLDPKPIPPLFDPVSARPRNDVSRWVTTDDYRDSWINRDMTGTARFTVTINANGNVENCRIVASTGHKALDSATCKLVERRAKFDPARDSNGDKVADTFTKSIRWQLPE